MSGFVTWEAPRSRLGVTKCGLVRRGQGIPVPRRRCVSMAFGVEWGRRGRNSNAASDLGRHRQNHQFMNAVLICDSRPVSTWSETGLAPSRVAAGPVTGSCLFRSMWRPGLREMMGR